jgi:acetyl esterase
MALDGEIARIVDALGSAPKIDLASLPLEHALDIARAGRPLRKVDDPVATEDTHLSVPGNQILVRCYRPEFEGPLPLIFHLHGGGWVTGSVERDDGRCTRMARRAGALVVSIDYRLSPEFRYPVAVDDALAAWDWTMDNLLRLGGDPRRTAISGASAGGQIAVALLLRLRARGTPLPDIQLLAYPALDPFQASRSYEDFRDGPFLTRARMVWYWDQYLGKSAERSDPLIAPLTADLGGLPPAYVQVAECDVLRDEGIEYVTRLLAAGVAARFREHPGMIHGFLAVAPDHPESLLALEEGCDAIRARWRSAHEADHA